MQTENSLRDHILQLEEKLLQPDIRKSSNEIEQLLADDFMEIGCSGRNYNRQQVIEALQNESTAKMTISDFEIMNLAETVVLATFRETKFNAVNRIENESLRSSIWKMFGDKWKMIFHQGTLTTNL
ncbi:MAG: DUF4440 domain-containing protein [Bacteroidetes bacterium]|nr:DUF4440 domain-containing protein [Bacteroidota bacterium]